MSHTRHITLPEGSSASMVCTWTSAGVPMDLTGATVDVADASANLVGFVSHAIEDAAAGKTRLTVTWDNGFTAGATQSFRLMITLPGGLPKTTREIGVNVV